MSLVSGADLSDAFPEGFEIALQNRNLFDATHTESERSRWLFQRLHPDLLRALEELPDPQKATLLDGFATYEIANGLDSFGEVEIRTVALETAVERAHLIVESSSVFDLIVQGNESLEASRVEVPRLLGFGKEILGRYVHGDEYLLSYGLIGIALARMYHMSNEVEIARILTHGLKSSES